MSPLRSGGNPIYHRKHKQNKRFLLCHEFCYAQLFAGIGLRADHPTGMVGARRQASASGGENVAGEAEVGDLLATCENSRALRTC